MKDKKVKDIDKIRIKIASPDEILSWSHGEVTKPETINYRTQKAEKDGLFCEKIFGPEKDYQCYCGKYKRIRYKGIVCDRCGVEVTKSSVRRERMGHIKLAAPVSHIWFIKGIPSRIGMVLNTSRRKLEKVIYFSSYIVTSVREDEKERVLEQIEEEYERKAEKIDKKIEEEEKVSSLKKEKRELRKVRNAAQKEVESIERLEILSEADYRKYSLKYGEIFEAGTGAESLRKICEDMDLDEEVEKLRKALGETSSKSKTEDITKRLKFFQAMKKAGIRPEWMFMTVLPVLPPGLRPMVQLDGGRYASSDLNDLYRRVINRNNRLKHLLEIKAPEVILRNEKRMLQEAVDSLLDNSKRSGKGARGRGRRLLKSLADVLKGKQGRFRRNLLGKRVDYSGRSVIITGPDLKYDQVGLPKKMALELFKPFVIRELLDRELAYNVRGASKLMEQGKDEVWECLEDVVKDKVVLLNRAPTLHRLSVQAFYPVLIEGKAIKLHPVVCSPFNADFDGDQMAVHLPLSKKAQEEAKDRMLSSVNLLKPATGKPVVSANQDLVLGSYWLSLYKGEEDKIFSSFYEAILAYESDQVGIKSKIKVAESAFGEKEIEVGEDGFVETSVGRILFNEALPEDFPFQNRIIQKGVLKKDIIAKAIREYPREKVKDVLDSLKRVSVEYTTVSGITWGLDDLIIPEEKEEILKESNKKEEKVNKSYEEGLITDKEKSAKIVTIWGKAKNEIRKAIIDTLPRHGSVYQMIEAGARGSWEQVVQMCGMKGLVASPTGDIIELPIKDCYYKGLSPLEYFISTHGARKGQADRSLRTSSSGYLTRRLVDASHQVVISEKDCGDDEGIIVKKKHAEELDQDLSSKIVGRVCLEDLDGICEKGDIINWEMGKKIKRDGDIQEINVRSPISCNTVGGVCSKCYGWDLGCNKLIEEGEAAGVVAAQAIGEPGTQLTMRTFHTGGVLEEGSDITFGLPRVEEILELRNPSWKAKMAEKEGKVAEITSDKVVKIKSKDSKSGKEKTKSYKVPLDSTVRVKRGDKVEKGQQLCDGNLDIEKLFKLTEDREKVWRYILREAQRVYAGQGIDIHDKHIEIVIRQMFSRVKIDEPGDTPFNPGQIVEKASFIEENEKLDKNKATAKPLLLGLSKVALHTDSFLSAASFQRTSSVLIKAASEGQEDDLKGLKENVIVGKMIPVGTGFKKKK